MPERVFRDLGGGNNLPLEAWEGATAEGVRRVLSNLQPDGTIAEDLSFLQLAAGVRMVPVSEGAREILARHGPELLEQYQAALASQESHQ